MAKRIIETITEYEEISPEDYYKSEEQVEDACCENLGPIICYEEVVPWYGFTAEEVLEELELSLDEYGRDSSGNFVDVRLVSPDNKCGCCGEQVTRTELNSIDCCDVKPPLAWDSVNSVKVLAPGGSGYVYVSDGIPPFDWAIGGSGFTFDGGRKGVTTDERVVRVNLSSSACGTAHITVSDKCREVYGAVKSSGGQWVRAEHLDCEPDAWDGVWVTSCEIHPYKYDADWCADVCSRTCLGNCGHVCDAPDTTPYAPCWTESTRVYKWVCI